MTPDPALDSPLAWGTVGWASDSDTSFYDLGDSSSGVTLVNVTLFRGRNPAASELDHSVAQGHEITCQLGGTFFGVPPKGTRVLVAGAEPGGLTSGNATILQAVDPRGTQIFGAQKPGDVCISAIGSLSRLIMKADGIVTIYVTKGNVVGGASICLQILPDGSVNLASPYGAIALAHDSLQAMFGTTGGVRLDANGVALIGNALALNGGQVSLGANASQNVVLSTLLATQLVALATWVTAVTTALSIVAPIGPASATLLTALGIPNFSTSVFAAS